MYSFKCDYSEGVHPKILDAIVRNNEEQNKGYGEDIHCENAIHLIKKQLKNDQVDVHFLVGGTQTNLIAISAFLRPHEAVIAADSGHIYTHETGAIEATGHKVYPIATSDGKLTPAHILEALEIHCDEHMVKPKLVFISDSTEIGTIYSREEVEALSKLCKEKKLYLYMDGARLASALTSSENNINLSDLPDLVDAFYIGGTKNGAMMGEALVICNDALKEDFRYHMKQKGALLAKGSLLGIQFETYFQDNLYFEIGTHTNHMATILKDGLADLGCKFLTHSPSNQLFPILPNPVVEELEKTYSFIRWEKISDTHCAIRLVTSWATKEQDVITFLEDLKVFLS